MVLAEPVVEARVGDGAAPALADQRGVEEALGLIRREAEEDLLDEVIHQRLRHRPLPAELTRVWCVGGNEASHLVWMNQVEGHLCLLGGARDTAAMENELHKFHYQRKLNNNCNSPSRLDSTKLRGTSSG